MNNPTNESSDGQPEYPDDHYEHLARTLGEEQAGWHGCREPNGKRSCGGST